MLNREPENRTRVRDWAQKFAISISSKAGTYGREWVPILQQDYHGSESRVRSCSGVASKPYHCGSKCGISYTCQSWESVFLPTDSSPPSPETLIQWIGGSGREMWMFNTYREKVWETLTGRERRRVLNDHPWCVLFLYLTLLKINPDPKVWARYSVQDSLDGLSWAVPSQYYLLFISAFPPATLTSKVLWHRLYWTLHHLDHVRRQLAWYSREFQDRVILRNQDVE